MTDDLDYDPALVAWLRRQLDEDERVARAATLGPWQWGPRVGKLSWDLSGPNVPLGGMVLAVNDAGCPSTHDADHITCWDPVRALAEIAAKRRRIDWLVALKHDDAGEGFPTHDACRILVQPGKLGDLEVGYCSCGLDAMRMALLRVDALPYATREGFRDEWRYEEVAP